MVRGRERGSERVCRKEAQGEGGGTIGTDSEAEIEVVAEGP